MKLLNFQFASVDLPHWGVVIKGYAVSFETLMQKSGQTHEELTDVYSYLENLPGSEDAARELLKYGEAYISSLNDKEKMPLENVKILPPVPNPRALIDFGLSPRHLGNSSATLIKHAFGVFGSLIAPIVRNTVEKATGGKMLYYKGNHNAIIGDNDTIHWPSYSSYLDIEPELAIVTGNEAKPIAGYTIFNDSSARDIQLKEMLGLGGPARSKDFDRSNGLGPFIVTPDEVGDPLALNVKVKIGNRMEWKGSTSEYCARPEKVIEYLKAVFTPIAGNGHRNGNHSRLHGAGQRFVDKSRRKNRNHF